MSGPGYGLTEPGDLSATDLYARMSSCTNFPFAYLLRASLIDTSVKTLMTRGTSLPPRLSISVNIALGKILPVLAAWARLGEATSTGLTTTNGEGSEMWS